MRGVPQSRCEMVVRRIHPFSLCDLVADPASITNMARLAALRAVVDRIERKDGIREHPRLRPDVALPQGPRLRVDAAVTDAHESKHPRSPDPTIKEDLSGTESR